MKISDPMGHRMRARCNAIENDCQAVMYFRRKRKKLERIKGKGKKKTGGKDR